VPSKAQYQYIVVRNDLPPGLQAAQVAHAAFDFALKFPEIARKWRRESNYICILQVPDEDALMDLADLAHRRGHEYVLFYDPDVPLEGDESLRTGSHTAFAVEPGEFHLLLSSLPLALREGAMM
jgi:peptidyl-tRNA hydrolase